jgi:FSR family fosmidomycin resistance protein-like MFS transporter
MAESQPAVLHPAAASTVTIPVTERVRPNVRLILLLSLGHFVVDLMQGSVPAILPFLKNAHGLSYLATGTIVLGSNLTSSVIQPVFGYLADQTPRRWVLPVAVALAGVGLALLGVAPSFPMVLALVLLMGFGIAAYHPEGYKTATGVAGERKATALSWFSLGGNAGIACGPPVITVLVTTIGLAGSLAMLVPTLVVTALLLAALPRVAEATQPRATARVTAEGVNRRGAMALLVLVVMVRAWTQFGFMTYVPLYYLDVLKAEPRVVGALLFVFLGAGALGTVIAGPIADRWGTRAFIRWAFLLATPFAVLFLVSSGAVAFIALGLMGAVLVSTFTISVVLGQQYLPRNAGMASGLIVGFAIGTAGVGVTLVGWLADSHGLATALWFTALLPVLGFGAAMLLPAPRAHA